MLPDIPFKLVYSTGEDEPVEFFFHSLLESSNFDLGLGYFSSSGFRALAIGFAYFISKGGRMRILINDILLKEDKEAIKKGIDEYENEYFEKKILDDVIQLTEVLSGYDKHFFNCLSFLISEKRLEFKFAVPKDTQFGIAHSKYGVFSDPNGNKVGFSGSANFSMNAFYNNIESISCYKSWTNDESDISRLNHFEDLFDKTWKDKNEKIRLISIEKVKTYIADNFKVYDIEDLINNENDLIRLHKSEYSITKKIEERFISIDKEPRFPFSSTPREYQMQAYSNWVNKGFHGIFAMATGTGKTITSLNCILEQYKVTGEYKVLILVPTLALVEQWKKEIGSFNFKNIIEVSGITNWREELTQIKNDLGWRINHNFFILTTYSSFTNPVFQKLILAFPDDLTIIADEAHNIGATKVKESFERLLFTKRIALSATPKRVYDPEGTSAIETFFNDSPPYCYSYSMEKAITLGNLCHYFYFPKLVNLNSSEYSKYIQISKRLLQFYDSKKNILILSPQVEKLLLIRKQIIHKANNKIEIFREIIQEINSINKLKFCFTYVPEGYGSTQDDTERFYFIEEMIKVLYESFPNITYNTFLGGDSYRNDNLRAFSEGKLDVLFAMKCLDEGIDVPRAEVGIFASSSGNPRQFIQRRGRLLRNHPDKNFAYIYDMIVVPDLNSKDQGENNYSFERNQVMTELRRVAYFASLSDNFYFSKEVLKPITDYYNIDIDIIIQDFQDDSK